MPDRPAPRVLVVSNDFLPQVGGIQQYTNNILERLTHGAAFVAAHPDAASHDDVAPYPVRRGRDRYLLPGRRTLVDLRAAVEDHRADVVLLATPWPLVGTAAKLDVPVAVCNHGAEVIMPARVPGSRHLLGRELRKADLLYAVSRNTASWVRRTVGPRGPDVRLLLTGVPLDTFTPDADGREIRDRHGLGDDPVVVCVGRLVPRKGQDVLVEAWPRVRDTVPDARLLLVGTGPLEDDLRAAAAALPDGAVTLTGRVPWEELPAHHAAADVFAHPNRDRWFGIETEGFGVIFLEAQACARPVVAGDAGGAPEALVPGETGLLCDGSDPDDVARAVTTLLTDPDRACRMGVAGRTFVEEHFDWARIVAQLERELAALAAGSPLPTPVTPEARR